MLCCIHLIQINESGESGRRRGRYQNCKQPVSIVLATAKRARQLIDHADPLVPTKDGEKAVVRCDR